MRGWSRESAQGLTGVRFNVGRLDGGVKPTMIADACEVGFTLRTLPGQDGGALLDTLRALAPDDHITTWETRFLAPALPGATDSQKKLGASRALAERNGLPVGAAVDFWSEAALFSDAGRTAIVFGSGDPLAGAVRLGNVARPANHSRSPAGGGPRRRPDPALPHRRGAAPR